MDVIIKCTCVETYEDAKRVADRTGWKIVDNLLAEDHKWIRSNYLVCTVNM